MTIVVDQEGAIKAAEHAEANGVKRYMMLSSMGADRAEEAPDDFKFYLYAKHRADEYLRNTDLDYTIVRPGGLTNDPGTGKVNLRERTDQGGKMWPLPLYNYFLAKVLVIKATI